MGDAHAEHAPEGLVDPAVAWATFGAHVVNAKGAHDAIGGGGVSVYVVLSQDGQAPEAHLGAACTRR